MIVFFGSPSDKIFAVRIDQLPDEFALEKLVWLFGHRSQLEADSVQGPFVGPRAAMITPWSTNAVEITQNMGIVGIQRIEEFFPTSADDTFDPMVSQLYEHLHQAMFDIPVVPEPIQYIKDVSQYNEEEGLALSQEEVEYLDQVAERIGRPLTDSEVFGFSQVNSEHCRHKIFNGTFIIDGKEQPDSLFQLIKKTSKEHPNDIVSAYKDNVAFIKGPKVQQFAPERPDVPSSYVKTPFESVISVKAETHNFPTTVEPFSGAATGSGGEIRDRLAGGQGAIPLAGTAVYMTAYSRLKDDRSWEKKIKERPWLYQTPLDILIKASNGASDFGNKFGQPLIAGSLLTFEHEEGDRLTAYDKVIMLAGGVGYSKHNQSLKQTPKTGDHIVVLGGDNYRIGMGGAAVSSADTGAFGAGIELNAVQRSNPEMQKRVANTIRALVEDKENPIVSIHDHGAGGHLNCLSELVEEVGGKINLESLPVGDPTLSAKEIIGNESQERMGLLIAPKDEELLRRVEQRERSPMYTVGEVTGDDRFTFSTTKSEDQPIDLALSDMFGSSPKTIMEDVKVNRAFANIDYDQAHLVQYISDVLRLEAVACKDWLTNKVDRCVGGRVAKQQCAGPLQLPLNNYGIMALDFDSVDGIATAIGHAPGASLLDAQKGARLSILEALTNIVWAPLKDGLTSISLSANWMWPCRNEGEDARLYEAVKAVSDYSIALGINVPTGKDSLSMKQKYSDREVLSPGTVIISSVGHCINQTKAVEPVFQIDGGAIYYVDLSDGSFALGGSSFAQTRNQMGKTCPDSASANTIRTSFDWIQKLALEEKIVAGHDISAGGMLTALLEMCFSNLGQGAKIDLSNIGNPDTVSMCLSEAPGLIIQANDEDLEGIVHEGVALYKIGEVTHSNYLELTNGEDVFQFDIPVLRDTWYETSYLLDQHQTANGLAKDRYENYKEQPLKFQFPEWHTGQLPQIISDTIECMNVRSSNQLKKPLLEDLKNIFNC